MKKILIIEDDATSSKAMELFVRKLGHESILAKDGLTGLQMARLDKPDLILLDVLLPKMDGFKVCRMLKFDENYKHIPIIICSSKMDEKDKTLGLKLGADAYLTKPLKGVELKRTMTPFLKTD